MPIEVLLRKRPVMPMSFLLPVRRHRLSSPSRPSLCSSFVQTPQLNFFLGIFNEMHHASIS